MYFDESLLIFFRYKSNSLHSSEKKIYKAASNINTITSSKKTDNQSLIKYMTKSTIFSNLSTSEAQLDKQISALNVQISDYKHGLSTFQPTSFSGPQYITKTKGRLPVYLLLAVFVSLIISVLTTLITVTLKKQ